MIKNKNSEKEAKDLKDNYFKSTVCLNSFNSGFFFEKHFFLKQQTFVFLYTQLTVSRETR